MRQEEGEGFAWLIIGFAFACLAAALLIEAAFWAVDRQLDIQEAQAHEAIVMSQLMKEEGEHAMRREDKLIIHLKGDSGYPVCGHDMSKSTSVQTTRRDIVTCPKCLRGGA